MASSTNSQGEGNTIAVTAKTFGAFSAKALNAEIDWDTDTIKVSLHSSTYTPAQDSDDYFNDCTNEITGTGYTAGGVTLANKTRGYTAGTNVDKFDADDVTWTSSTLTARYAVIYKSTGTASTSPLIAYVDFGVDVSSSNGPFTLIWDSAGIFTATHA